MADRQIISQKSEKASGAKSGHDEAKTTHNRVWDALIFFGVLFLSALAIFAVALITPVVLIISALAGLLTKQSGASAWRPVSP